MPQGRSHARQVCRELTANLHRPVGKLIPRQQVSSEGEAQDQQQQPDPRGPDAAPRLPLVGSTQQSPQQMQTHDRHQAMTSPAMKVARQAPVGHDRHQILNRTIGTARARHVVDHQQRSGAHQNDPEKRRHQTQSEGRRKLERTDRYHPRMQVPEEFPGSLGVV